MKLYSDQNRNKIIEIRNKFAGCRLELVPLHEFPGAPEVIEDGDSFRENAEKKAREICNIYRLPFNGGRLRSGRGRP